MFFWSGCIETKTVNGSIILVLARNADIVQPQVPEVHFFSENNQAAWLLLVFRSIA